MAKGMTDTQKETLRKLLDKFKRDNGGCVLCGKKIDHDGWHFSPVELNGLLELHVYGSCTAHSMLVESEGKMDMEVLRLREELKDEKEKPVLMSVTYSAEGEQVKYA